MSAPSNTRECVLQFKGRTVFGVLMSALPLDGSVRETVTIVFDDGSGLTFTGAFWAESRVDVELALGRLRRQMETAGVALLAYQALAEDALRMAGEIRQEGEPRS